jgi:hypothetical protein
MQTVTTIGFDIAKSVFRGGPGQRQVFDRTDGVNGVGQAKGA